MINEQAVELGRQIGQTDDYKAVQQARDELDKATELSAVMQRMERLAEAMEDEVRRGKEPPKEKADEYQQLLSQLQADPRYQKLVAAQANFEKLMVRVNERIMEGMKKGAESPIITLG
ncbi:MAG: YlbF family regulator [Gemmatimonadales bacterium]